MRVWILLLTLPWFAACGATKIVEKPVPYPVPGPTQYVEVPADLTLNREKTTIPESITYGQALELWSRDRSTIDTLNGQLLGIKSLNEQGTD